MKIRAAGNYPQGDYIVDGLRSCCGKVCNGVALRQKGAGGFVVSAEDILALAEAIKKRSPARRECLAHGRLAGKNGAR